MKKTYISPALHIERMDAETLLANSPDKIHDQPGKEQLVNENFWDEEVTDIWNNLL